MTIEEKRVEFRIRARFEGQKTLTQLTEQIDQLTKAQEKQIADAEKGTAKAKELDITYQKLERSLRAVAAAHGESMRYEKLTSSIATLQQRLREVCCSGEHGRAHSAGNPLHMGSLCRSGARGEPVDR